MLDEMKNDEETLLGSENTTADQVKAPGFRTDVIKDIPGPDTPLTFKIVTQKRSDQSVGYTPVTYHTHLVGDGDPDNKKNYRSHLCQKSIGSKECPECDKFYANSDLIYNGSIDGKESDRLKFQNKFFKPSQKGWLFVVLPGKSEVKALKVGKTVLDKLFGRAKTKYREEVPSLIKAMALEGNDPYDLRSKTGWLQLSKTGEGLGTEYTVKVAKTVTTVQLNGKAVAAEVAAEYEVNEAIFKTKRADLPNISKIEDRNKWKMEDSLYFSQNLRPAQHIIDAANGGAGNEATSDEDPLGGNTGPDASVASAPAAPATPATAIPSIDQML